MRRLSQYYNSVNLDNTQALPRDAAVHTVNIRIKEEINTLLNSEGRIAGIYWDNLARIINQIYPQFRFQGRKNKSYSWNMNASDEVNALLNYGYAILESEVRKAINVVGLDPSVGFLHELATSKTPLVYDVQEQFRWLIDLSVLQLLEEKKLKKSDFLITENYHSRLKENTAKMLIDKISLNFNTKVHYKNNRNYTFQNILFDQVQQLANFVSEKVKTLEFSIPEPRMLRDDSLEMREQILSITPEERKRLGINKSTLWYQKRNLRNGKSIRIYNKVRSKLV